MANLVCVDSSNAAIAYDFFIGKGLKDFQAAAVIGNLQQESGINPRPPANSEGADGIAQWRLDRLQNLFAFAGGRDPHSLDVQLEFLWHELQTNPSRGLGPLLASRTLEDATTIFQNLFERPNAALAHTSDRIAYANSALLACPNVYPPEPKSRFGVFAAVASAVALVAAVGYGVFRARKQLAPPPPPRPLPPPFVPSPEPAPTDFG